MSAPCVEFSVNGKKCKVDTSIPYYTSLSAYIRYTLALPGTKAMCREGGCGSCIVTVRARRPTSGAVEAFSVNSCLVLVFSCHGWEITTIEGTGNRNIGYSEIQKRIVTFNGTQCGYCTPGFVMSMNSLLDKNLSMAQLEKSFGSNTCRCTGYRPILDTMKSFAIDASPQLCQKVKDIEDLNDCRNSKKCSINCSTKSLDTECEVLSEKPLNIEQAIFLDFGKYKFYKVFDIDHVFELLNEHGVDSYMLVDGNTAKGLEETHTYPNLVIDISNVKALKTYEYDQNLVLGANVTLEDCISIFRQAAMDRPDEFAYLEEFAEHFELVAHIPVRKIGSLAGNSMVKHKMPLYPSDIFLLFSCVDAVLTVRHLNDTKKILTLPQFLEYDMQGVVILNFKLPPLSPSHIFRSYKIMPRNQNALAIVNAAFLIKLQVDTKTVDDITIAYGGIRPEFIYAAKTENFLKGKNIFSDEILLTALHKLASEINPVNNPPDAPPKIKRQLAVNVFYKFILNICPEHISSSRYQSGGKLPYRSVSHGNQSFQTHPDLYPVSQPVLKYEGFIQSAGEAQYINDIPPMPNEVFGSFVLSTTHSGEVDKIYIEDVLKILGVLAVYTPDDIPGKNSFIKPGIQLETEDEEILATKILYYGQPIAIVVAESEELAGQIAKQVRVTYKNESHNPPVLTIDEAKKYKRRYVDGPTINPKGKGNNVQNIVKGVYKIEAQYHYYLEPITCVVVPVDKGVEVFDSTQWMDLTQLAVAQCLGINESQVVVRVRRIGGGFGGKISRNVQATTACAVVAKLMDRPCRFILPMQTNMTIAGKRLPSNCEYEAGVDEDGKIQYLNANIVEDDGCSHNESILEYTAGGFSNCYNSDYFSLKTGSVVTDLPSNTFCRAPGTNEGISTIEHIMEHIAFEVKKDSTDVRLVNMRTDDNDIPSLIKLLKEESDYDKRAKEIEEFNKNNRWMKKSIKISVMLFPVEYYGNYSALVSIYRGDGTVTVTTGGIEMGQGVNTKAAQICAYELGIPYDYVSVLPSYTFTAANNIFSGSSIVSESVCFAIIKCCEILNKKLKPIKAKLSNPTWKEIIQKASEELIDLVAEYQMSEKESELQNYNAFSVTILEVQLDCLTGKYQIERVDILEDAGLSTSPNIDVGQVEGAYIQGLGYFTSEKLKYDLKTGRLLTNRSQTYHVPLALDIPVEFNVKLKYNSQNNKGVLGSKTVGEMGICTAHGITHALRECIQKSRNESRRNPNLWIDIDVPYTTETILEALDVDINEMCLRR